MSDLLQHRIAAPRRARHAILLVAATIAASAITTPAWAVVSSPPRAAHQIISFPARDFVSSTGYDPATQVTVEAWRNGHLIGRSSPITPAPPRPAAPPPPPRPGGSCGATPPGRGVWARSGPPPRPGDRGRRGGARGAGAGGADAGNRPGAPRAGPRGGGGGRAGARHDRG